VLTCVADAERGEFSIHALATFVAGIPSYVVVGELAVGKQLAGVLPRPQFPAALAAAAPPRWRQLRDMGLATAGAHAGRGDAVATVGNLAVATLSEAQARMAEQRQWALNEKGIVEGAGLGSTAAMLAEAGSSGAQLTATVSAVEGTLRR
jgi:hypothetical protein